MSTSAIHRPTPSRRALLARLALAPCSAAFAWAGLPLGAMAAPAATPAPGDLESPVSAAEQWLLLEPHLARLALPTRLVYRFESTGSLTASESYELSLQLQRATGAGPSRLQASVRLPRNEVPMPLEGDEPSNPIVTWFLDRDVALMEKLTGGQRRHFQKRVRYALAETQQLESVRVERTGASTNATANAGPLAGQQIQLQPYLQDPLRQRFEKLAGKRYRFTLAKGVAGQVWQIQTVIPGATAGAEPLLTETLSFVSAG